jgi:hypothetical protein
MRNEQIDPSLKQRITEALMAVTSSVRGSNTDVLITAMESLDDILSKSRDRLHPQLRHFLENRSYQKALTFLENADG